ncbi:hypothetical protein PILCRDRAFT_667079 [Piloderma croceum F 1598]|uniref:Uncharacterized protein n=1 Tax=Piloderma croceum (strain F 1598) TaxID=765440 RepID=A0A0C3ET72_PILCF|nr:hypothetical protein PILCRDRAFT_667079 [Piloderma croceum F 1598]
MMLDVDPTFNLFLEVAVGRILGNTLHFFAYFLQTQRFLTTKAPHLFELAGNILEHFPIFTYSSPSLTVTAYTTACAPRPPPSSTFGVSQADFGNAAMTVGGTVLRGIKSLGGMAYSAAKARVGPHSSDQGSVRLLSSTSFS